MSPIIIPKDDWTVDGISWIGYDNVALAGLCGTFCIMCVHKNCLNCISENECGKCESGYLADSGFCCKAEGCKKCKTFNIGEDDGESCE